MTVSAVLPLESRVGAIAVKARKYPSSAATSSARRAPAAPTTKAPSTTVAPVKTVRPPTTTPWYLSQNREPVPADREVLFDSNRNGNYGIYAMHADGSSLRRLVLDDSSDAWWPRPSRDRTRVLFYRTPAGVHDLDYTRTSLWVMNIDGSQVRRLREAGADGWDFQGHAEWSPDGLSIVMFGGQQNNPQLYLTDAAGQHARQLTDRPGTNIDPSFAPDGASVAFTGCPQASCYPKDYEIYVLSLTDGSVVRITNDQLRDHDPTFSPDRTTLAWLTEMEPGAGSSVGVWDVRLSTPAPGAAIRKLYGDRSITSRPVWESNDSLLVHRIEVGIDSGFQVYRVKSDGTGSQRLTNSVWASEYPA